MPDVNASTQYVIRSTTGASVTCLRGQDAPTLVSGGARYNVVTRPRRKSTIQWDGDDPYRMDLSIVLDGFVDNKLIESDVAKLNQMMQSQGDFTPPVQVFITGAVPVKGARWVIESIDWGTSMVIWNPSGRLRQDAVIHLLQYVPQTVLQTVRPPSATTPYRIKAGDTLASIAARYQVTESALKSQNKIRDPKTIKTKIGQLLLIPPSTFGNPTP